MRRLRHEAGTDPTRAADADAYGVAGGRAPGKFMTDANTVV
jgi:hypothetical protein